MLPIPTNTSADLHIIDDIKLVVFDIYGTLLISGSGEVGSLTESGGNKTIYPDFYGPVAECNFEINEPSAPFNQRCYQLYRELIESRHINLKSEDIDFPEVDILSIWFLLLSDLIKTGTIAGAVNEQSLIELSLLYEIYNNPTWLMPGAATTLEHLHSKNFLLGIVSNAQFYTKIILEALLDRTIEETGFLNSLVSWSFQNRKAKPSLDLFSSVQIFIQKHSITPQQVVYVGNDMLNDMYTSHQLGYRTILFAGDERSLRLRKEKEMLQSFHADAIITGLPQLLYLLNGPRREE